MSMTKVSFRLSEDKREKIDYLAGLQDRDRSYIINEAIDSYLELQRWQLEEIDTGIRQADRQEFASEEEVQAAFDRWKQ